MRASLLVMFLLCIVSCNSHDLYYNSKFYEKVTGIRIPADFKVIESFDNWEFLTGTTFKCDSLSLLAFVEKYNFMSAVKSRIYSFGGDYYRKGVKPDFKELNSIFFISKSRGKNDWLYIADIKRKILWADIMYPDSGGQ